MNSKYTNISYSCILIPVLVLLFLACMTGDIRLVNGSNSLQGRVEVCYDGVWGTVCSDLWSRADAIVACRQLGFSSLGAIEHINAAVGEGATFVILLDDVQCTGREYRLFDCRNNGLINSNCDHTKDAGVVCAPGKIAVVLALC